MGRPKRYEKTGKKGNISINIGGFAIPIRGASSRGITESQEYQPPL
jgi:hypothetical protein